MLHFNLLTKTARVNILDMITINSKNWSKGTKFIGCWRSARFV